VKFLLGIKIKINLENISYNSIRFEINAMNTNASSNLKEKLDHNTSTGLTNNVPVATHDSIKFIAESIGITNLSEEACRDLASDLTFVVKSILNVINLCCMRLL
jgi:hypothetical protein